MAALGTSIDKVGDLYTVSKDANGNTVYTFNVQTVDIAALQAFVAKYKEELSNSMAYNQTTFKPTTSTGTTDVELAFNASKYIQAQEPTDVVAYEFLVSDNKLIATHTDINDEGQSFEIVPSEIGTTLTDKSDADHYILPSQEITLVDTVEYTNLVVGKEYTLKGTIMDKETERPLISGDKEVTATTTFVPNTSSGFATIEFVFDASALPEGKELVAFEELYKDGIEVAVHTDINDEAQTVKLTTTPPATTTETQSSVAGSYFDKTGQILKDIWPFAMCGLCVICAGTGAYLIRRGGGIAGIKAAFSFMKR